MEPAKGSDCRMTLKERLKCLNLMIPCNEGYGQLLAQRLKAFLNTPLSEIMYGNTTIYHQLYEDIADAEEITLYSYKVNDSTHTTQKLGITVLQDGAEVS